MLSFNNPRVITTTRNIRKSNPLICLKNEQGGHIVGLNLVKLILNYYSTERDITIDEEVLAQLIEDINDASNFSCISKEQNVEDKYTEEAVIEMIFRGDVAFEELSEPAKNMFILLKKLLRDMIDHLKKRGLSKKELKLIAAEIEKGEFPLPRQCQSCKLQASLVEETSILAFCNIMCQQNHYDGK